MEFNDEKSVVLITLYHLRSKYPFSNPDIRTEAPPLHENRCTECALALVIIVVECALAYK